jgi:hypothetical protein
LSHNGQMRSLLVLLATFCWQNHCLVRLPLFTRLPFYSKSSDGKGLNMTSISVTNITSAISGFQEDSAHVSVFLPQLFAQVTDWDEIGVIENLIKNATTWPSWRPRETSKRTSVRTNQHPNGKWVRLDTLQSSRNFKIPF